jgi:sulfate/thiosulfate transport system permease protein
MRVNPLLGEPRWVKRSLIVLALTFLLIFLLVPLCTVFAYAFSKGVDAYMNAISHPETLAAIRLTLLTAGIAVPLNVLFGLSAAWLLGKFEFRGKSFLLTLIDLPLSISPVVAGLVFVLLFGRQGLFGSLLTAWDVQIIFAVPGIILATLFVTLPYVVREVLPVMEAQGNLQEEAALTLGASGMQTFMRVTLPKIRWGVIYGVILCNARAMGEFGAVAVVSGHIRGLTNTLPLHVEILYNEYNAVGAFAVASLLTLLALATLALKKYVEWRSKTK